MADRPFQKALTEFLSEAQEIIDALDRGLLRLDDTRHGQEADPDTLNAVFRAAHSLKGLAAMFGVERMTRLAHALEDRLDQVRMGRRQLDAATLDVVLAAPGLFARIVAEEAAQAPAQTTEAADQLATRLLEVEDAPARPGPAELGLALDDAVRGVLTEYEEHRLRVNVARGLHVYRVRVAFDLATFDTGLERLKASLKPLGEVVSTLPSSDAVDPSALAFDVLVASAEGAERLRAAAGASAAVEIIPRRAPGTASRAGTPPPGEEPPREATPGSRSPAPQADAPEGEASLRSVSRAVRVDIAKLDRLMNLVGELVLVKTSLLRIAERLRAGDRSTTLGLELHRETRSLDRKVTELQGGVLEVRMVPLGQLFDKLGRMARKLARDLDKQVELEIQGSDVELDKLIVEELSDPLMHLVRNALDHALEPGDVRARAGKPAAGRITLSAAQRGNHVVIRVEDDGAGIDEARIRQVAVARGLVPAETVAQLSHRELMNLIFIPGFSTAPRVTALSGRGVGMDVVKSNVAAMSGVIDLHTEAGRGTRFEITLPVTLAILRALIVSSAGRTYALPLNAVLEIVTADPTEVRTVELREVMTVRGSTLPLVRLNRFLGTPGGGEGPLHVVVVGLAQARIGIVVDGLLGQQDVVVKPLGRALAGVRGIAGATDLGNRRTVLVLDVTGIVEETAERPAPLPAPAG